MKTRACVGMMLLCLVTAALVPRAALALTNNGALTLTGTASATIPPSPFVWSDDCGQILTAPACTDYEQEGLAALSSSWFDYNDCLAPPLSIQRDSETGEAEAAPGLSDLSEYMIGDVAVTVIFPESNGSIDSQTETWSTARIDSCLSEIAAGLTWWENQEPRANLEFDIHSYGSRSTGYEPIRRTSADEGLWIDEILTGLGYSSGAYYEKVAALNGYARGYYNTDWAYTVFVVDSYNDSDGEFLDGLFAYSYLGGPFLVMTYDNDGYGIDNMDVVAAHESGHTFWATDEYDGETEYSGYLNRPDSEGANCIMAGQVNWNLCSSTRGQLGWVDTDGDNILDPLDTVPSSSLQPYLPNPTSSDVLTYYGSVNDVPLPNNNPQSWSSGVGVSLNTIMAVQYRIDSGSWYAASSVDGAFDEGEEEFTFTTPALSDGSHLIQTRARNSVGNWESSYPSDTIAVETNPTITIGTTGLGPSYPATVHYWQSGTAKTAATYGTWSSKVDRGSLVTIDSTVAVSSTERYSTNAVASWTANETATHAVTYYHQCSTIVSIMTAGTGHADLNATNNVALTSYQFGSAVIHHLFDAQSFNDWVDVGSTCSVANSSSGSTSTRRWQCPETKSWTISSTDSYLVTYWDQVKTSVSVVTAGTGHADLNATNNVALTSYQFGSAVIHHLFDAQSFNDWVDTGSTASLPSTSSTSMANHRWYAPGVSSWLVGDANSNSVIYQEQCQLTVSVTPSHATSASGSGWYEIGQRVNLVTSDLVNSGTGVRFVFAYWSIGGSRANASSTYVSLDTPRSAEARYRTEYYLDIQSIRGNPQGSGWYDSGSEVSASVESSMGVLVRQVFAKWEGDSSERTATTTVVMDGPKTVAAKWRTDYVQLFALVGALLFVAGLLVLLTLVWRRGYRLGDLPGYLGDLLNL